jgi:hypothetical protein
VSRWPPFDQTGKPKKQKNWLADAKACADMLEIHLFVIN